MSRFVGIDAPRRRDDDDPLREFFVLYDHWMRDRKLRTFFVHALVALGVVTWYAALRPQAVPAEVRQAALLGWALCFVAAAASAMSEHVSRRRFEEEARTLGAAAPDVPQGGPRNDK